MVRTWFLAACLAVVPTAAHALESAPVSTPRSTVWLDSETDGVEAGRPFRLGLRFHLSPGWHIYWSNPGDAGIPPQVTLKLPDGATSGGMVWPAPQRLAEGPVMTYSYAGDVLLPVTVTPKTSGATSTVDADASWLVCENICVPEEGSFHLSLPIGPVPMPSAQASWFADADARTPRPSPFVATITAEGKLTLAGSGLSARSVSDAWFFPDRWGVIDQSAAQRLAVHDGTVDLWLTPGAEFDTKAGVRGVAVLQDPSGQQSFLAVHARPVGAATAMLAARMLLFAALGGLLLNLMPCVFPVLAIKAVSLARLGNAEHRHVRLHAAAYTLGVVVAFGLFGLLVLVLRQAGIAVGWGFQFQSPAFVAAIAWLLFAVGLNLSGVYAVGGGLAAVGSGLAARRGLAGSFFTGSLAVVVATPCTAPFMGGAVAAALAAPAGLLMSVFLALGAGLAAPYLVLAWLPGLAGRLPKPGAWMDLLRQALAFPMYAASGWLVWVVSRQAGSDGVLSGVTGLFLVGLGLWTAGAVQRSGATGWTRRAGQGIAVAAGLAALGLLGQFPGPSSREMSVAQTGAPWEPYSAARLADLRRAGKPVFVNMTAAWCVTCLVNELVALDSQVVRDAFARHHVAYLKGDWTLRAADVTAFLKNHGRAGVPLYVLYPPGDAPPDVLPQILTESIVLDELRRLGS
jgi:thiol:disulfide interchange protein DsbD